MKKRTKSIVTGILVFVLLLALALPFAACGDETRKKDPDEKPPVVEPSDPTATELIIDTKPTKTSYYLGEKLDLTGIVLKVKWSDGLKSPVSVGDCTVSPDGELAADTTKITITYRNVSAELPIEVKNVAVASLTIDTSLVSLKGSVDTPMDFRGIVVTATYADDAQRTIADYEMSVGGKKIEDVANVSFSERGSYPLTVAYGGVQTSFTVEVFNGFMIEAENIKDTAAITEEDKNFVEVYQRSSSGGPSVVGKDTEPASGNKYLGAVFNGTTIRFHVDVETACYANIILRASSAYMLEDGGSWSPVKMGDQQFNRLFDVRYGSAADAENNSLKKLYIEDDVILAGGETDKTDGDPLLYVNWKDVNFSTLPLAAGDNVIELKVVTDYVNCRNENVACNIDRLEIEYTEDYTPPATVTELKITHAPAKVDYFSGESFDPTGLTLEATMSDDTTKAVTPADCTITPAGPLTVGNDKVTIEYRGVTVEQPIAVSLPTAVTIEGENLKADPAAEDINYVEAVSNGYVGKVGASSTEVPDDPDHTSGGKFLNNLWGATEEHRGATVRFHIHSDIASKAKIVVYAASVKTERWHNGEEWKIGKMGDVVFNQIFGVKFGSDPDALSDVTVDDSVIVAGGELADSEPYTAHLWENWKAVEIGTFDLVAGDNILELENINKTITDMSGQIIGMKIDKLVVNFVE